MAKFLKIGMILLNTKRVKVNGKAIKIKFVSLVASVFAVITAILSFVSFEDFGIQNSYFKLTILIGIVIITGIISLLLVLTRNKRIICDQTNCNITIRYGDLMELGFPKKTMQKRIIVIPVNQCFDLSCENNLIRESSVHGQWIGKYIHSEVERSQLNSILQKRLKTEYGTGIQVTKDEKREGNLLRYPAGTTIEVQSKYDKGVTFYLLSLAKLDTDLKAQCTEIEFHQALLSLLHYYDLHGQGVEMFVPVMSDKTITPPRPTKNCIDFMLSILRFNQSDIRGKINIVVYSELKDKVSILDY